MSSLKQKLRESQLTQKDLEDKLEANDQARKSLELRNKELEDKLASQRAECEELRKKGLQNDGAAAAAVTQVWVWVWVRRCALGSLGYNFE